MAILNIPLIIFARESLERRTNAAINNPNDILATDEDDMDTDAVQQIPTKQLEHDAIALKLLRDIGAYDTRELEEGFTITVRGSANTIVRPEEVTRDGIVLKWETKVARPAIFARATEVGINPMSINPHAATTEVFIPSPRPLDPKQEKIVYLPNDNDPVFLLIVCPWEPAQRRTLGAIGGSYL